MLESHNWVGTTFERALDYSNSKPPLNVWLIAISFKSFGVNLVSLRLPSIVAATLTVLVLLLWAWRRFSPGVAVCSAFVLATCFGFLYVHSGRSANPDAPLGLFLLLIVVVLDASSQRPWRRAWLGPLLAAVFLLKGMAVMMPLLLIALMETRRHLETRERWLPLTAALAAFCVPVGAWALVRWNIDQGEFFSRLFFQDFVALSTTALDNQSGSPLFYLDILQKHHYDWLIAALIGVLLFPPSSWAAVRRSLTFWKSEDDLAVLIGTWSSITLLVPTLVQTKLPWYLNPFYPMFALGVGWILSNAFQRARQAGAPRLVALVATVVLASAVAESKLLWYSLTHRPLEGSSQNILMDEADRLRGGRVFRSSWDRSERFVLRGIVQAEPATLLSVEDFVLRSRTNDYLLASDDFSNPHLIRVRASGRYGLFKHHHSRRGGRHRRHSIKAGPLSSAPNL
jgi:4-amino-4-deoxy-L-arabinose transferase-like glycosyltransferase